MSCRSEIHTPPTLKILFCLLNYILKFQLILINGLKWQQDCCTLCYRFVTVGALGIFPHFLGTVFTEDAVVARLSVDTTVKLFALYAEGGHSMTNAL